MHAAVLRQWYLVLQSEESQTYLELGKAEFWHNFDFPQLILAALLKQASFFLSPEDFICLHSLLYLRYVSPRLESTLSHHFLEIVDLLWFASH